MEGFLDFLFSSETLAIVIPLVVFLITLVMVVKRLISFVITLVLLAFAIVSGLAIVNYEAVSRALNNDIPEQRYEELRDGLQRFQQQIREAFQELRRDIDKVDDPLPAEDLQEQTSYLMNKVERQEARLNHLIHRLDEDERMN